MNDGKLPSGWTWAPLSEVGEWYGGGTPSKNNEGFWTGGTIPWLSPKDMGPEVIRSTKDYITDLAVAASSVRIVPEQSVALVMRSGILERTLPVALVPFETTLNQDMKAVRARHGVTPAWIAWALRAFAASILKDCRKAGTTVSSLSTKALLDFRIPIAPLPEQHRVLEALEGNLSRLNAGHRSLIHAQALIPRQFRAICASATEGRVAYKADDEVPDFFEGRRNIWKQFHGHKKYQEPVAPDLSSQPELPEGWRIFSLESITHPVRIIRYGILMPKVKNGGEIPYVEVKDLKGLSLHGKELHRTSRDLDEKFSGARIRSGDVLLAVRGSYDRSAVVPEDLTDANISRDVARIAPLPGLDPEYLQLYLQSVYAQRYFRNHARGVAVKGVNISSIRALPVAIPSLATQKQIVDEAQRQITSLEATGDAIGIVARAAAALRRSLLADAFKGRLVTHGSFEESDVFQIAHLDSVNGTRSARSKQRGQQLKANSATFAAPPHTKPYSTTAVQQELPL